MIYQNQSSTVSNVQSVEIHALVATVLQQLSTLGYCWGALKYYRQSSDRLRDFAERRGITTYTPEVGEAFLTAFTSYIAHHPHRTKTLFANARTAVQKLDNSLLVREWSTTFPRRAQYEIAKSLGEGFHAFLNYWEKEHPVAKATLAFVERAIPQFLRFLETNGIKQWNELYPAVFSAYFASRRTLGARSLDGVSTYVRLFMRFLLMRSFISRDWEPFIPRFRPFAGQHLPPVWTPVALEATLAAIDRSKPQGKRDFAIILLASRLGMRAGDIRSLQLEHLNWEEARIEFHQHKTGVLATLPMTEEVGNALIDYLRSRPKMTAYREVFLRVIAPYQPLKTGMIYNQLNRYCKLAGVRLPKGTARGLHALRHTLASRLQSAAVPLGTISGILGHASLDSTRIYARVDLEQLRTAALDPDEVSYAR